MSEAKTIEQLQCRVDRLVGRVEHLSAELAEVKRDLAAYETAGFLGEDDTLVNNAVVRGRIDYRDANGLWCVYVEANGSGITVGRTPDNTIAIASPSVARRHCRIYGELGRFWIRDAGTAIGTYVNQRAVGPNGRILQDGDQIRCAALKMTFLLDVAVDLKAAS
jgi:hypothetical protein